jgi:hypothetical protein
MKKMKILLTLFAVFLLAGCGGGGSSPLDVTDMAGTYGFTKATVGAINLAPPAISGSLSISAASRYGFDIYVGADRFTDSGAVSVSDPNITLVSSDGSVMTGIISDGGRKVSFTDGGITLEFTKI